LGFPRTGSGGESGKKARSFGGVITSHCTAQTMEASET
jgi:hypothetical protein